ncbi:MAG TPA: GNAT family N-acetyltransferase [Bacteroidales bacterium]|nr:GNAT family N-acetyltransferase [Bacteroidales bacterium]
MENSLRENHRSGSVMSVEKPIRYLRNHEIDKLKWDQCVRESFNGNLYGWSWYLDIVHKNWEALVEGDYERVFPLTGNTRFGVSYLFQPFFAQQLGVYSRHIMSEEVTARFLRAIPSRFKLVEIRLNKHNKVPATGFGVSSHTNIELDLIHTYERIHRNYSSNTKRNLRKAQESGLWLSKNIRPEQVVALFRDNRGRTISHWNDREYRRFVQLAYTAIHRGQAVTYGVYDKANQLLSGALFVKSNGKIVFLFSGTSPEGKAQHALTFMIDSIIREHAPGQYVLDFEGSDQTGLARFYLGFGGQTTTYPGVHINRLPWYLHWPVRMVKKFRKMFR